MSSNRRNSRRIPLHETIFSVLSIGIIVFLLVVIVEFAQLELSKVSNSKSLVYSIFYSSKSPPFANVLVVSGTGKETLYKSYS